MRCSFHALMHTKSIVAYQISYTQPFEGLHPHPLGACGRGTSVRAPERAAAIGSANLSHQEA